jgi:hypothetical protein
VQGDDGPHFGEGGDAVGDPGGSRAGGGARHGVSGYEPSARDSLSIVLRELTQRAVRAFVSDRDGTTALRSYIVFRRAGVHWCATRVVVAVAWGGYKDVWALS